MLRNTNARQLLVLIILTLFLRILNFSFPAFTADEARVAFRGNELYKNGVDELGRRLPFIFNSSDDYQLPVISYVSVLGARAPFILIGLFLVLLTYKVATQLSKDKSFHFFSAFLVATSPVLIFISKVPNESIILTTLFLLLFYLFNKEKINIFAIICTIIVLIATSKYAWFVLAIFVPFMVFIYRNSLNIKEKLKISLVGISVVSLIFILFLSIPQGARSLSENNLSLLSDVSINNGINRLRGQSIESGWPPVLGRLLINKLHFFPIGALHWLSNIQPAVFFSQFSEDGNLGFVGMGAFPKIAIIPALLGFVFLVRERKDKLLLLPVIITLPAALIYPQLCPQVVILTLPFIAYILTFGILAMRPIFRCLIVLFLMVELLINSSFLSPQIKLTNDLRPDWIEPIVQDAYKLSDTGRRVFISDDITRDPGSFIEWYTPLKSQNSFSDIPYPYKIRQTVFGNIKLVGFSDNFWVCDVGKKTELFLTKRDLNKVKNAKSDNIIRTYLDSKDQVAAYFLEELVCQK